MHQDKDWRVTQVLVRRCVTATAPERARLTISDSARRYFPLLTQIPWCLALLNLFFLSSTLAPPCHRPAQCLHPSRHSAIPLTTPLQPLSIKLLTSVFVITPFLHKVPLFCVATMHRVGKNPLWPLLLNDCWEERPHNRWYQLGCTKLNWLHSRQSLKSLYTSSAY